MTSHWLPIVALTVFLGLHYPISRGISQIMVVPPAPAEPERRFQYSLVDWLALLVLLQIVFAMAGPFRQLPTRLWDWVPLAYFLGSVALCWWASVPALTRGSVRHPAHRFIWLLCLVPINVFQTLIMSWLLLALLASVTAVAAVIVWSLVSSFPWALPAMVAMICALVLHRARERRRGASMEPGRTAELD
jgi:hypothetical protein